VVFRLIGTILVTWVANILMMEVGGVPTWMRLKALPSSIFLKEKIAVGIEQRWICTSITNSAQSLVWRIHLWDTIATMLLVAPSDSHQKVKICQWTSAVSKYTLKLTEKSQCFKKTSSNIRMIEASEPSRSPFVYLNVICSLIWFVLTTNLIS